MKIFSFLLIFLFAPVFVFAQEQPQTLPSNTAAAVTVATVNVENGTIIKNEGSRYTVAFDISNREGVQGEIRYAVGLRTGEKNIIIDRMFYDKVVSLSANEKKRVEVTYELPSGLVADTSYTLFVESSNKEGLTLGMLPIGNITGAHSGTRFPQIQYVNSKEDPQKVAVKNILLDKDGYQKGDTANISFFWVNQGAQNVTVTLQSGEQVQCAEPVTAVLDTTKPVNEILVPVTSICRNPEVTVTLQDGNGQVVAESRFRVESLPQTPESRSHIWESITGGKIILLVGLMFLVGGLTFVFFRKRQRRPLFMSFLFLSFLVAGGLGLSSEPAAAGTHFFTTQNPANSCSATFTLSSTYTSIGNSFTITNTGNCSLLTGPGEGAHHYTAVYEIDTLGADILDSDTGGSMPFYGSYVVNVPSSPAFIGAHTINVRMCVWLDTSHIGNVCAEEVFSFNVGRDGVCGSSSGTCDAGSVASYVTGSDQDTWTCTGVNGGSDRTTCVFNHAPQCGSTHLTATSPTYDYSAPSGGGLCYAGTASAPTRAPDSPGNNWSWTCSKAYPVQDCSWVGSIWTCTPASDFRDCGTVTGGGGGPQTGQCGPAATTYASGATAFSGALCNVGTATPTPSFPAAGSSTNWTCSGVAGGSSSGTCIASRSSGGTPSSSLKVCQNSCSSGILRGVAGETRSFSLALGGTQNLVACYNTATDCSDSSGDVTSSADWTDFTPSTVSLSGSNPRVATGNTVGSALLRVKYGSGVADLNVTVACVPTVTCNNAPGRENYCESETFSVDNGCGTSIDCNGVKSCDYNWKEVAP